MRYSKQKLIVYAYKWHKDAKKQEYGHQVRDNEHGIFTPLVFTSTEM